MSKFFGMNAMLTIWRRVKAPNDDVGGRVETYTKLHENIPGRIVSSPSPLIFRMQGIETQDFYQCVAWSPDYNVLLVQGDDIVVPQAQSVPGKYDGWQFKVQSVEDSSIDDNRNSYLGMNKKLNLKRETPRTNVVFT